MISERRFLPQAELRGEACNIYFALQPSGILLLTLVVLCALLLPLVVFHEPMLIVTPSTSSARAKRYFGESLKRDDYYLGGQEIAGQWFGKGAKELGLSGQVDPERYFALCDNINPATGEQLTPRQKQNRRPMYDWTLSAPKAVSVLYELSGDDRILEAFRESVTDTMKEAEREMKTRVRKGGKDEDRVTGNLVGAEFIHFTARPVEGRSDPHLHAHCVVFNTTFDPVEKRWKASQQGDLKRDADYWEASFDARFAKRLNDLGYATAKDGTSFTLAGLPKSVTDKFSQRRNEIEAQAAEQGVADAKGKHAIGARIREHKQDTPKDRLRQEWQARLSEGEADALRQVITGTGSTGAAAQAITPQDAINYALEHSFERASAVSEKRLKAEALRHGVGSVLPEDVARIGDHRGVIAKDAKGQRMTTTQKTLDAEVAMLQFAVDGHGKCAPFALAADGLEGLSDEQRKAALHVIRSRDRITGVVGKAGTGKTHMMKATIAAIESEKHGRGRKVFVFAPSSQASRGVLKKEGFENAETLEMLLKNEKLQAETKGQVLWIDEAGLISSRTMKRLFDVAERGNNRIILSGDYTQHSSVEAGDAFRLLQSEAGVRFAELRTIRRQKDAGYRKAVEDISQGTGIAAQKGFDALDRMGCIVEATGQERHRLLVGDYLKAVKDGKSALIIAPTRAEGQNLTEALRGALKERGALGEERTFMTRRSTGWTTAQKGDARNYETGMVVEFHQNAKGFTKGDKAVVPRGIGQGVLVQKQDGKQALLPKSQSDRFEVYRTAETAIAAGDRIRITRNGRMASQGQAKGARLNNGDVFTVEGFTKDGGIKLDNGNALPKNYGHFSYGYVDTSHASQGKTVDRVFIATGSESLPAVTQAQWYVSVSRGKESAKVYVDSKEDVRNAIARTGERMSAVELTGTKVRASWRERIGRTLERNRVARFVKARTDAISDYWRNQKRERSLGYGRA
jgi:conjugative relaxase-like TrwC/TraI family protein